MVRRGTGWRYLGMKGVLTQADLAPMSKTSRFQKAVVAVAIENNVVKKPDSDNQPCRVLGENLFILTKELRIGDASAIYYTDVYGVHHYLRKVNATKESIRKRQSLRKGSHSLTGAGPAPGPGNPSGRGCLQASERPLAGSCRSTPPSSAPARAGTRLSPPLHQDRQRLLDKPAGECGSLLIGQAAQPVAALILGPAPPGPADLLPGCRGAVKYLKTCRSRNGRLEMKR